MFVLFVNNATVYLTPSSKSNQPLSCLPDSTIQITIRDLHFPSSRRAVLVIIKNAENDIVLT